MTKTYETLADQSRALAAGQTTAVALAQAALEAAEHHKNLNAFVALDPTVVIEQAKASDIRRENNMVASPLDGLPIAVKDNYLTSDYPTTACSNARPSEPSGMDATVIANLRAAGAVIFGKTNMHEWAYGATNTTSCFGGTRNPHNLEHITGGSSGGSGAAVAAGIVHGALGSDTGGSVRIPSSACGIYGFKPTYGRASRFGVLPLSWSLDAPGPMATSLEDLELMLPFFLGHDPKDVTTQSSKPFVSYDHKGPVRIRNLIGQGLERSKEVGHALTMAFTRMGIVQDDIALENMPTYFAAWEAILHSEASAYHQGLLQRNGSGFSPVTRAHLEAGMQLKGVEVLNAQAIRTEFTQHLLQDFGDWDILTLPTLPVTAPKHGDDWLEFGGVRVTTQDSMTWFCWLGNLAGLPCLTVPISLSTDGLPIGMMFMGRPGQDEKLLAMVKTLEARGLKGM